MPPRTKEARRALLAPLAREMDAHINGSKAARGRSDAVSELRAAAALGPSCARALARGGLITSWLVPEPVPLPGAASPRYDARIADVAGEPGRCVAALAARLATRDPSPPADALSRVVTTDMSGDHPIEGYCERSGPGLLAEPLNLGSNSAFVVAGFLALGLYLRQRRQMDAGILVIVALLFAVGIGSALFHSFAAPWALIADVGAITAFMYFYLGYYLRAVVGWSGLRVAAGLVAFFAVNALVGLIPPTWFNGSQMYFGALIGLLVLAPLGRRRDPRLPPRLMVAAVVFAVSLALRTVDAAVCEGFPWGTHFLWHILNGVLLYLLARAVVGARVERRGPGIRRANRSARPA